MGDAPQFGARAVNVTIKGWCPGALRPMESGDGLLVRVKPRCSALTLDQAEGIADIAARVGYSSASTFSVAFARHVGQPPTQYARELVR